MEYQLLISNLTNPVLLFFALGIIASVIKSDLEIPATSVKFISLYLLFSIGFKGGQELQHSEMGYQIFYGVLLAIAISALIPLYTFFILKKKLTTSSAGAVAASYGSVSAVTFVAAASFLEMQSVHFGGHMIAIMALMEFPAIIVAVILMKRFNGHSEEAIEPVTLWSSFRHSISNSSVLMIMGSLVIGIIADTKQAEGIKPFTTDIFKGFLAIFLLEMGMVVARRFKAFLENGVFLFAFATIIPLLNGCFVAFVSGYFIEQAGDRFIFSVLAASASYIAVPAAMRFAAPKADPGLYVPMALGVTFPFNITIGLPLYYAISTMITK